MRFLIVSFLMLFSLGTASAADMAAKYYVPPGQLNASIQVMNQGMANIIGLFSNATGSFNYDDSSKTLSNLKLAVDTTSIVSGSADNKTDLSNLLEVSQYPEIRFTVPDNMTFADNKASLKGTLTLHGTSKPITLDATLNSVGKTTHSSNAWANEGSTIGLSLHGNIKRADFGMNDTADTAGRFGDTIALQLEIQAIKQ